jgi:hypothetical protein
MNQQYLQWHVVVKLEYFILWNDAVELKHEKLHELTCYLTACSSILIQKIKRISHQHDISYSAPLQNFPGNWPLSYNFTQLELDIILI